MGEIKTPQAPSRQLPRTFCIIVLSNMDHLLPSVSSKCTTLEVPYLFDKSRPFEYDNGDWEGYPERVSWDVETFMDGDFTNGGQNTSNQAASFLQAWLYFGIIYAITGVPVNTSDFVRDNSHGVPVVTTKDLPRYISAWKKIISELSEPQKQDYTETVDTAVKKVTETITLYIGWRTPLPNEVILSIMILHKTLIYSKNVLTSGDYEPRIYYYQESREVIDAELYKRGWCKRDVAKHHQAHSCLAMYFAISLGPRLISRDHTNCSQTECLALQIDKATYLTRHTKLGCNCEYIGMETEQLVSIIENGMTPLIKLSQLPEAECYSIDLVTDLKYVCISHVWSDGLGNPHDNSLPRCQLELLQTRVNALYDVKLETKTSRSGWTRSVFLSSLNTAQAGHGPSRPWAEYTKKPRRCLYWTLSSKKPVARCLQKKSP